MLPGYVSLNNFVSSLLIFISVALINFLEWYVYFAINVFNLQKFLQIAIMKCNNCFSTTASIHWWNLSHWVKFSKYQFLCRNQLNRFLSNHRKKTLDDNILFLVFKIEIFYSLHGRLPIITDKQVLPPTPTLPPTRIFLFLFDATWTFVDNCLKRSSFQVNYRF